MVIKNDWIVGAHLENITLIQKMVSFFALVMPVRDSYYFFLFIGPMRRLVVKWILLVLYPRLCFEIAFDTHSPLLPVEFTRLLSPFLVVSALLFTEFFCARRFADRCNSLHLWLGLD